MTSPSEVGQTDSRVRAQYAFDDTISSSAEGPYLCLAHIRQVTRPSFGHYCSPYKGPSLNADDDSGSRLSITCTTGVLRRCDPMPLGQLRMCTQWFTWPPMAVLHVSVSAQQKALYCWQLPLNAPYAFVPKKPWSFHKLLQRTSGHRSHRYIIRQQQPLKCACTGTT
jgi:hypothetical protein